MTEEPDAELDDVEFRATRFGVLPARVLPDDQVAMTETDPPRHLPDDAGGEDQWMLRAAGG
jgi:hypothetical protein